MARMFLMMDGVTITSLEDLKEQFNPKQITGYYKSKRLHAWLRQRGFTDEAEKLDALGDLPDDDEIILSLMEVFDLNDDQVAKIEKRIAAEKAEVEKQTEEVRRNEPEVKEAPDDQIVPDVDVPYEKKPRWYQCNCPVFEEGDKQPDTVVVEKIDLGDTPMNYKDTEKTDCNTYGFKFGDKFLFGNDSGLMVGSNGFEWKKNALLYRHCSHPQLFNGDKYYFLLPEHCPCCDYILCYNKSQSLWKKLDVSYIANKVNDSEDRQDGIVAISEKSGNLFFIAGKYENVYISWQEDFGDGQKYCLYSFKNGRWDWDRLGSGDILNAFSFQNQLFFENDDDERGCRKLEFGKEGIVWQDLDTGEDETGGSWSFRQCESLIFNPKSWLFSRDGIHWQKSCLNDIIGCGVITSICECRNEYFAVYTPDTDRNTDRNSVILHSSDGASWTQWETLPHIDTSPDPEWKITSNGERLLLYREHSSKYLVYVWE